MFQSECKGNNSAPIIMY